ncbi:MAG: hypothetical protein IKI97_04620 [Clostridia bacterium]|nr:hypothetical protein [Clostridia bacterium]
MRCRTSKKFVIINHTENAVAPHQSLRDSFHSRGSHATRNPFIGSR